MIKKCNVHNISWDKDYFDRYPDFFERLLSNLNQSINQVKDFNHRIFKFDVIHTYEVVKRKTMMVSRMHLYNKYISFTSIDNDELANYDYSQLMQIYQWQPIPKWQYEYEIDLQYLDLTSCLSTNNCIRIKLGKDLNQFKELDLKAILILIKKIYDLFFVNDKLQKNQFDWSSIRSRSVINFQNLSEFVVTLDLKNFANSMLYLSTEDWSSTFQLETLTKKVLVPDSPVVKFLNILNNYKNFNDWLNSNK